MLRRQQLTLHTYALTVALLAGNAVLAASGPPPALPSQPPIKPQCSANRPGPLQHECRRCAISLPVNLFRLRSQWRQWPSPRCVAEKPGRCYTGRCDTPTPTPTPQTAPAESAWLTSYKEAVAKADRQNKMLLIYFCDSVTGSETCSRFKAETLDTPEVRKKLSDYVCVQIPLTEKITVQGQETIVLEHDAFREMQRKPGVAIVDYRANDAKLRGMVVSTFPITESLWYTPEQMSVILTLPPGTLTQRTLIYAVRTHPEKPASTESAPSPDLVEEAQSHARYQADIHRQGHQFWESRFQRIVARLPLGLTAREVCAESWPNQGIVEAAVECVRCWRTSSGHWSAVRAPNHYFGYDMQRGSNGIWYATGIFSLR